MGNSNLPGWLPLLTGSSLCLCWEATTKSSPVGQEKCAPSPERKRLGFLRFEIMHRGCCNIELTCSLFDVAFSLGKKEFQKKTKSCGQVKTCWN